jgi:hypothetical protein
MGDYHADSKSVGGFSKSNSVAKGGLDWDESGDLNRPKVARPTR